MMSLPTARRPALTPEALGELFDAFSRTSRQMERSHAELKAKVADLRRELRDKDRRLQEKKRLEALGLVVAGVAHEFRNPLGSISLYLDCLLESVEGPPGAGREAVRELGGKIETAVRHLDSVVEDMLIFSRGASSALEPCDLPRLLEEALLLLRGDLEEAGAEVQLTGVEAARAAPAANQVRGDRDQVVRVLVNVLKNAVEAVAAARPRVERRIEVDLRWVVSRAAVQHGEGDEEDVEHLQVAVRDNGPGVAPEKLERLCVPFYTDKQDGVGLGLSIVHSLMERQGGRVEIENAEGGGLRVRLLFRAGTRGASSDRGSSELAPGGP